MELRLLNLAMGELTAPLKLEGEAGGGHVGSRSDRHRCGVHERQHAIGDQGRNAQREVHLLGPSAAEHCHPEDQTSGLDALNVGWATAVFYQTVGTHPRAINSRHLSQVHRALSGRGSGRTKCRAPDK